MLWPIIGAVVVLFLGLALLPLISQQIQVAKNSTSIEQTSTQGSTILSVATVFFAIAIMAAIIAVTVSAFNNAGLISEGNERGYDEDYNNLESEERHKQTYKEYVRERLEVEMMMKK